jgi:hypothetical protein
MHKFILFLLISFSTYVMASGDACKFTLNLENKDDIPINLVVKQLTNAKTQDVKNQYILITAKQIQNNQWQFSTLPLYHVIEIDFITQLKTKTHIGSWTIGYKGNCIIQSVGNKIIGKDKEKMSLTIINTEGTNDNIFNFKIFSKKQNMLVPSNKS